jgi:hypothetical protein
MFADWHAKHNGVEVGSTEAAEHGELVVNATNGAASLEALRAVGEANLDGKVLIDISNRVPGQAGGCVALPLGCGTSRNVATTRGVDILGEDTERIDIGRLTPGRRQPCVPGVVVWRAR